MNESIVFTLAILHACTCIYVMTMKQRVQVNFVE